jgi:DNA mismatch endonuclease (patch repair protein)
MDRISPEQRSANMRAIRGKHTSPELTVRKMLTALGHRYRLHAKELPGKPDIVFRRRKKAIFVHGCFWHQHGIKCSATHVPVSNTGYWKPKLDRNLARDAEHLAALTADKWQVLVVWECECKDTMKLERRLRRFLRPKEKNQ